MCILLAATQVKRKVCSVAVQCNLLVDKPGVQQPDSVDREPELSSDSEPESDEATDPTYNPNEDEESDEDDHCVRRPSARHIVARSVESTNLYVIVA